MAFFGSMGSLTVIEKCEIIDTMNYKNTINTCLGFIALPLVLTADVVVNLGSYNDSSYAPYASANYSTYQENAAFVTSPGQGSIGLGSTFGTDYLPLTLSGNLIYAAANYSGAGLQYASIVKHADGTTTVPSDPVQYHRIQEKNSRTIFQHSLRLVDEVIDEKVVTVHRSVDTSFASVFFYEKEDFLGDASTGNVSFASGDSMTAHFEYTSTGSSNGGRMIIRNAGSWYISKKLSNGDQTVNSGDDFYAFNLESNLIIGDAVLGDTVDTSLFTNIEAVGIHMEQVSFNSYSQAVPRHFFEGFDADLTVTAAVPELISFSTILPFCVVTFLCLRRSVFGLV